MQLSDWLTQNNIKRSAFAERIGVSPQTITGWCDGSFWISATKAQLILDETAGAVTPNDFLAGVKAASEAAQ
jgi:3,4-dihydroxy 2-butanone 4-phosphate synthase/GTP cyclohydrolase II